MEKYLMWLKAHEKLLIIFALIAAALYGGNRYLNWRADRDDKANTIEQAALKADKAKDATLAQQAMILAQTANNNAEQLQKMMPGLIAVFQAALGRMDARNQQTQMQQKTDLSMPLPLLAERWQTLLALAPGEITNSQTGLLVSDDAAHKTVVQLEEIPRLQGNLADEKIILDGKEKQIGQLNVVVSGLNNQVGGLNAQVGGLQTTVMQSDKACQTQVAAVKSANRKANRNWFLRGAATVGGIAIYVFVHGI